ncbi:MAG TPA: crossover junction endodeoxyribonuclease RuvC [Actinomycetota bacterium]|nr:crossover junction endodeoxyribonuclease RuvC [Actinomycetota bacterium]
MGTTVIGIDPGLTRMGFAVVRQDGSSLRSIDCGAITTAAELPLESRLDRLFTCLTVLMTEHAPHAIAVERVFLNKNALSAIGSIQASGIALLAAARCGAPVTVYSPAQVKQAVVGTGSASKDQVRYMVERIAPGAKPASPDAADAIAIAITHLALRRHMALEEVR